MASPRRSNEEKTVVNEGSLPEVVSLTIPASSQPKDLEKLQHLLKYLDQKILRDETTHADYLTLISALFLGSIGSYTAIPLGGGFGQTVGVAASANAAALRFLSGFFGAIAYLPTTVLVTLANQAGLIELTKLFSEDGKLFKKQARKKARRAAEFLKYFFAPFTGIPFVSLTVSYIDGDLGAVLAVIAGISCFTSAMATQSRLIDKFFLHYEPDEVKAIRLRFNNTLNTAVVNINGLSGPALDSFYELLMDNLNSNHIEPNALLLTKIKQILNPPREPRLNPTPLAATSAELHPWVEKGLNVVSVAIGTAAIYTLHTATELAVDWFNDQAGINDLETRNRVKKSVTVLALIPNALFSISFIEQKIHKTCHDWLNKKYCPTKKEVLAAVIASASSTPNTFLAIDTASTALQFALIAPAFLGPMFARSVAFGILLNKGMLRFNNIFYKNATETRRDNILNMLEKLRQTFFSVDPVYLYELETALTSPSQAREEKAMNSSTPSPSHVTFHGSFFQPAGIELELQNISATKTPSFSAVL